VLNKILASALAGFCVLSLFDLTFSLPAFVSAALTPVNDTQRAAGDEYKCNPAKTSSGSVEEKDGKLTREVIRVGSGGNVTVSCTPAPFGEEGYVVYCNQDGKCKVFAKGTPAADNLLNIYGQAASLGDANKAGVSLPAQTLVQAMYDPDQLTRLQDNVIGHDYGNGIENFDYGRVLDATVIMATPEEGAPPLAEAQAKAVAALEYIANQNDAQAAPLPPQGIPGVWPNWMGVASELDPTRMTDELTLGPPWKGADVPALEPSGSSVPIPNRPSSFSEPQSTFAPEPAIPSTPAEPGLTASPGLTGSAPGSFTEPLQPQLLSPFAYYPFVPDIQNTEARLWELETETTQTVQTLWQEVSTELTVIYSELHDWLFPPVILQSQ
jgi:hypothetical protein